MWLSRPLWYVLPAVILGCASPVGKQTGAEDRHGGIFNYNESNTVRSLFPPQVATVAEQRVASQIYEGLVAIDPVTLGVVPALAESWELDTLAATWTFHLRSNVHFHDDPAFPNGTGREVTAADVVQCFMRICSDPAAADAYWLLQGNVQGADAYHEGTTTEVSGLEAVDEHTVRIKLTGPMPNFLYNLANAGCWIWPQELLTAYGTELDRHAIGTGPFRPVELGGGEVIVLDRNARYWGKDGQGHALPYLDGIRITLVPDKQREVAEFLRGHLSMVSELSMETLHLLTDSVDPGTGLRRFRISTEPTLSVQYYGFNVSKPPFNDVRVRQAFALAINKTLLVDSVLNGLAVPAEHGLVPPGFSGYPYGKVPTVPYAPDSARKLLAQAGYPGGRDFPRIQLQVNTGGFGYRETANFVQESLEHDLGVWITISTVPDREYFDRIAGGAALFWRKGWVADLPDPENFLVLLDGRNAIADTSLPSPLNSTRFADPRVDILMRLAAQEKVETKRYDQLAGAEALAMRAMPLIPLYHEQSMLLTLPDVMGLEANGMELLDLKRAWFSRDVGQRPEAVARP
jgi:oligopeptide transport system substrate-binding protein